MTFLLVILAFLAIVAIVLSLGDTLFGGVMLAIETIGSMPGGSDIVNTTRVVEVARNVVGTSGIALTLLPVAIIAAFLVAAIYALREER